MSLSKKIAAMAAATVGLALLIAVPASAQAPTNKLQSNITPLTAASAPASSQMARPSSQQPQPSSQQARLSSKQMSPGTAGALQEAPRVANQR